MKVREEHMEVQEGRNSHFLVSKCVFLFFGELHHVIIVRKRIERVCFFSGPRVFMRRLFRPAPHFLFSHLHKFSNFQKYPSILKLIFKFVINFRIT